MLRQLAGKGMPMGRDEIRDSSIGSQRELIDSTLARIMAENNDPAAIYLLDCHPIVRTNKGYILGVNPLLGTGDYFSRYGGAIHLVADPRIVAARSKADPARKRETDPAKIKDHQDLLREMLKLAGRVTGAPSVEVELPQFSDIHSAGAKEKMVLEARKALGEILSRQETPGKYRRLSGLLGGQDSFQNLCELRKTGELYDLLPVFSLFPKPVMDHVFDALAALDGISKGNFRDFYNNVTEKDATFEDYSKNMEFFRRFYDSLSNEGRKTLWLTLLLHDTGKTVQWGWRHYLYGRAFTDNMFRGFGLGRTTAKILSDAVFMHGFAGELILGDQIPGSMLGMLEKQPMNSAEILALITMVNFCDFMGWKKGAASKNEYLTQFRRSFDINYLTNLRDKWLEERMKRYSRPPGKVLLGQFDEKLYGQMMAAYKSEVPDSEKPIFDHIYSKVLNGTAVAALLIRLNPVNRVRFMHVLALIVKALIEKGLLNRNDARVQNGLYGASEADYDALVESMFNGQWPISYEQVKAELKASDYKKILGVSLEIEEGALFVRLMPAK